MYVLEVKHISFEQYVGAVYNWHWLIGHACYYDIFIQMRIYVQIILQLNHV